MNSGILQQILISQTDEQKNINSISVTVSVSIKCNNPFGKAKIHLVLNSYTKLAKYSIAYVHWKTSWNHSQ